MISDNQMDKFFNDRLKDHLSSVPADMWERIVEKKKRDRMIWFFFLRLLAVVILLLTLAGGYFVFKNKKSSSTIGTDSTKNNQSSVITNVIDAGQANLPSGKDHMEDAKINVLNEKSNKKENTQIGVSEKFGHAKTNYQNNGILFNVENTFDTQPVSKDSTKPKSSFIPTNSNDGKENKVLDNKDSLGSKPLVKVSVVDSSSLIEGKKPEKQSIQNKDKWYLDLFASPDYPIVTPTYYDHIVSKLSYTIGIKINRVLGKHFSVKSGVQYSQINIVGDDSLFTGATLHIKRLDLPVLFGYSFGKRDLKTTINGGVLFNLSSSATPDSIQNFFENNLGMSLYLGVNFEKRVKEKIALFAEPYYRYQLTSMTISSVSNVKFIDIVGISLGARYYFGK